MFGDAALNFLALGQPSGSHMYRASKDSHGDCLPPDRQLSPPNGGPARVWTQGKMAGSLVWPIGVFGKLFKRVTDAKTVETRVVAIGGYPLAAAFNSQCGEKGIRNEVAFDIGGLAQVTKDVPVAGTRIDDRARRLVTQLYCERQGFVHAAWRIEHVRVSDDSQEAAQHQIGQAVGIVRVDQVFKPFAIWMMVRRILTVGVDEHIDVKKNHEAVP